MAPFLRIAFNSYELGSLQAADDASQPFCAVKMKEALSTGRAGGYTYLSGGSSQYLSGGSSQVGLRVWAQREALVGPGLVYPECTLSHPHFPALPSCGYRTAEATRYL